MTGRINNPIAFVKEGYDQIAETYHSQRDLSDNIDLLAAFVDLISPQGRILDVGCGAGMPVTSVLVESGFNVTGIDRRGN